MNYQWVDVNDIKIADKSILENKKLRIIVANDAICSQKSTGYTLLDRGSAWDSIDGAVCAVLGTKYFIDHRQRGFYGIVV